MAYIYRIVHVASGRCYVGHTSLSLRKRWAEHRSLLKRGKHHSPYLQNVWAKYGPDAFLFEAIEECSDEQKLIREQHFVDSLNPAFNVAKIAGSRRGVPQPPEEVERVRQMMLGNSYTKGRVQPEEERARRSAALKGRPRPPETRAKIARALKGKQNCLGRVMSAETRLKIKLATDATRPTMTGKRHSEETRRKIAESNRATIALRGHHRTGTKHTEETKAKMRAAQAARFAKAAQMVDTIRARA